MTAPIATWNPTMQVWERENPKDPSSVVPYTATWPKSGMMRHGRLYPFPAPKTRAADAEFELLPTPVVNDMGDDKTLEWWDGFIDRQKAKHCNGNGHGRSLSVEVRRYTRPGTT